MKVIISFVIAFAVILVAKPTVHAQNGNQKPIEMTWLKIDIFAAGNQQVTPEMGLKFQTGQITGSVFIFSDVDLTSNQADAFKFLNFSGDVGVKQLSWIRFRAEASGNPNKALGLRIGPLIKVPDAPVIGNMAKKLFAVCNVAYHYGAAGSAPDHELYVLYSSKPLELKGWKLAFAGFHRFRKGPNFGQPQILIGHKKLGPVQGIIEVEWAGNTKIWYAGAKVDLKKMFNL